MQKLFKTGKLVYCIEFPIDHCYKSIRKIKVKGWSCKWFRLFLHESAALMCRKMSNYNLLCYSRIGSMMKEKREEK